MKARKWLVGSCLGALLLGGLAVGVARAQDDAQVGGLLAAVPELGTRPIGRLIRRNLPKLRQLRNELDLSAEQRRAIRETIGSHREEIRGVITKLHEQHRAVAEASRAEPLDEAAIRDAAAGMGEVVGDAAILRAEVLQEARKHLTPEQIDKIEAFQKDVAASVDQVLADEE